MKYLIDTLLEENIDIIGMINSLNCPSREEAIHRYLIDHPEITNYCIIDDDYDMKSFHEKIIKLPKQEIGSTGLSDKDVEKAIKILRKQ